MYIVSGPDTAGRDSPPQTLTLILYSSPAVGFDGGGGNRCAAGWQEPAHSRRASDGGSDGLCFWGCTCGRSCGRM